MKKNIFMTILVCITAVSMLFGILYHITGTIRPKVRQPKAVQIETEKETEIRMTEEPSAEAPKSEEASVKKETAEEPEIRLVEESSDEASTSETASAAPAAAEKETPEADSASEKSGIRAADIDLDLGDLKIMPGNALNVEFSGNEKLRPIVSVDNGTLTISQPSENNFFNLGSIKAKITVTLPKDTKLDYLDIRESLGDVELESIHAASATIDNDMGDVKLKYCSISDLTIESSLGDVDLEDTEFQKLNVKEDLGDVEIETSEDLSDATLDLQTDLGDVKVNGVKQGTAHKVTGSGGIYVKVANDMGDIEVEWRP